MTFNRTIDINEEVVIKLTPEGRAIVKALPAEELGQLKLFRRTIRIKLWEFIRLFGKHIEQPDVIIEESNLLIRSNSVKKVIVPPEVKMAVSNRFGK